MVKVTAPKFGDRTSGHWPLRQCAHTRTEASVIHVISACCFNGQVHTNDGSCSSTTRSLSLPWDGWIQSDANVQRANHVIAEGSLFFVDCLVERSQKYCPLLYQHGSSGVSLRKEMGYQSVSCLFLQDTTLPRVRGFSGYQKVWRLYTCELVISTVLLLFSLGLYFVDYCDGYYVFIKIRALKSLSMIMLYYIKRFSFELISWN